MSATPDILAIAKAAYENRHEPERLRPLARLYWRTMLVLSIVLVVGAFTWGAIQLLEALQTLDAAESPGGRGGTPALSRAKLEETLMTLDTRAIEFESLKRNAPVVADPSR